ncbi:bifunctional D-glycero-beta-D-manno-heptose-7-phosphate kinase/D-glycero-beta-D-manno-heptose 1-phosphate adenylyltransferase HldE [Alphaproteobacteria bacterium]|nr:bifunctional D-glycero-beta-D-manno-heptose-7-phosphate kinase/D-glycero-beta-D-manno-heptose 1-phosphate adenylyltransferase HldE [Alphaproteobacteria bacterium]
MKKILVVGDIILDTYTYGEVDRISPEAPVIILKKNREENRLGGAANVALNLKMLGANVKLIGSIGKDKNARILKKIIKSFKIKSFLSESKSIVTIHKNRLVSGQQQIIRVDVEDNKTIVEDNKNIYEKFVSTFKQYDLIIFSDYNKGTLTNIKDLIKLCKKENKIIIVDPKGSDFDKYKYSNILTPNLKEFKAVAGNCSNESEIINNGLRLIKELCLNSIIITRGKYGLTFINEDETVQNFSAKAKDVFDVTGAGDTFIATLALGLSKNKTLLKTIELANLAAGKVVGKFGTSFIRSEELEDNVNLHLSKSKLIKEIKIHKEAGRKIVFTNGCFDILHPGHLKSFREAKQFGDILVVAINSDNSVKKLKGESRPINQLKDRIHMLSYIKAIDFIIDFSEKTPIKLIKALNPDVLVKGNDYKLNEVIGADFVISNGGKVNLIELDKEYSTTKIIKEMRK